MLLIILLIVFLFGTFFLSFVQFYKYMRLDKKIGILEFLFSSAGICLLASASELVLLDITIDNKLPTLAFLPVFAVNVLIFTALYLAYQLKLKNISET